MVKPAKQSQKLIHYTGALFFLATAILFFTYHLAYAKKIIPGVYIANLNLGNQTPTQVLQLINTHFEQLTNQEVIFTYQNQTFERSRRDWGLIYEATSSAQNAYQIGRTGSFFKTTTQKVVAWFNDISIKPVLNFNQAQLQANLTEINQLIAKKPVPAQFEIKEASLSITPSKDGQLVNQEQIINQLIETATIDQTNPTAIPLKKVTPVPTTQELSAVSRESFHGQELPQLRSARRTGRYCLCPVSIHPR